MSAKDCVVKDDIHAFVVRIWRETRGLDHDTWRGSVEHVGHDKRLYFRSPDVVATFIREQAGMASSSLGSQRRSLVAWIRWGIDKFRYG